MDIQKKKAEFFKQRGLTDEQIRIIDAWMAGETVHKAIRSGIYSMEKVWKDWQFIEQLLAEKDKEIKGDNTYSRAIELTNLLTEEEFIQKYADWLNDGELDKEDVELRRNEYKEMKKLVYDEQNNSLSPEDLPF